jgi:hypothetical protein
MHLLQSITIQPNLELKTRPKQLLSSFPLDIALPECTHAYLGCILHWFALLELSCVSIGLG